MKAVILAGGLGTRLREETEARPKPLVDVGGKPILWHIMKIYSHHGVNDFVICLGYKGYLIKEYFANYALHVSDVTIDMTSGHTKVHQNNAEPWRVTLIDTGESTMTGGRLRRIAEHVGDEKSFCMTYGDGVSDVDIGALIKFHHSHGKDATLTGAVPPARFGALDISTDGYVRRFEEKPLGAGGFVNAGFFVLSPKVLNLIDGDDTVWERGPLETLARTENLKAFQHGGFWQPMDTLRDKVHLDTLWAQGRAPWKVW